MESKNLVVAKIVSFVETMPDATKERVVSRLREKEGELFDTNEEKAALFRMIADMIDQKIEMNATNFIAKIFYDQQYIAYQINNSCDFCRLLISDPEGEISKIV